MAGIDTPNQTSEVFNLHAAAACAAIPAEEIR